MEACMLGFCWTPGMTLEDIKKQVILAALRHYGGNKTKTAEALDISVRTIDYKLEQYRSTKKGVRNEKKDTMDAQEIQET